MDKQDNAKLNFTNYQKIVIAILAFLQFTVVLDFMIISPLGVILLKNMNINTHQFGLVVSAYAFSACISGIISAGFADRFDRRRFLLVFYAGFLGGTFLCSISTCFMFLLVSRIITGFFGGVIGSIILSIVADLFPIQSRGQVMGTIQSAFSASQILGIPFGLLIASSINWHAAFLMIVLTGIIAGVFMIIYLQPMAAHVEAARQKHPIRNFLNIVANQKYLMGITATMLVATGGFMLQPFASAFSVNNLGVSVEKLPIVYMSSGAVAMVAGPYIGRLSDSIGKFRMFILASFTGSVWIIWYTGLATTPLWMVIAANCLFALIISGRMSSTMTLITAIPDPHDRGAYMSMSSSMQQLAGGISSFIAGLIVTEKPSGQIGNYDILGWIVVFIMVLTIMQLYSVNRVIQTSSGDIA